MKYYRQRIISQLEKTSLPNPQSFDGEKPPAAVLLGIIEKKEPHILLTKRSENLSSHAGQVSFPGGHWEDGDKNLISTALREADEEVGLRPEFVEVSGVLPTHRSGKGQPMVPIVGFIGNGAQFEANPDEVADIFSAPLSFLMNFDNYQRRQHEWQGQMWDYYETHWEGFKIWGATANILRCFHDIVFKEDVLNG